MIQRIIFLTTYPLIWAISVLPHRFFYGVSDVLSGFVFGLVGYRTKLVDKNIALCFPEMSNQERKTLAKRAYRHFFDILLEMFRADKLSENQIKKQFQIENPELLKSLLIHKNVIVLGAHHANWEWMSSITLYHHIQGMAVYQKVNNRFYDQAIYKIRSHWGMGLVTQKDFFRTISAQAQSNDHHFFGMVADQSPLLSKAKMWQSFMGVKVPVFAGPESIATAVDAALVFMEVDQVKRGYYRVQLKLITDDPKSLLPGVITRQYLDLVEAQIRRQPHCYMWTHNRWKHQGKKPIQDPIH